MRDDFAFVFHMLEEGTPVEDALTRIDRGMQADETFFPRLMSRLMIYRENVIEGSLIPENLDDPNGIYATDRRFSREVLPRVDSLLVRLAERRPLGEN